MFLVEDFFRLCAEMHKNDSKLEDFLQSTAEKIAVLEEIQAEYESKAEGNTGSTTGYNQEDFKTLNEVRKNLLKLKEMNQIEKQKHVAFCESLVQTVVKRAETDSNLLGKCIALSEMIGSELKSLKTGENSRKIKDLQLINQIIRVLEEEKTAYSLSSQICSETTPEGQRNGKDNFLVELSCKEKLKEMEEMKNEVGVLLKANEELTSQKNRISAEIDQNSSKIKEIELNIALLKDNLMKTSRCIDVFMMENKKVCEITENQGKIEVTQRERHEETEDFAYWMKGGQLNFHYHSETQKWEFAAIQKGFAEMHTLLPVEKEERIKFLREGNEIFVGMQKSKELFKLRVEGANLYIMCFGKTEAELSSVCYYFGYSFAGLANGNVVKLKENGKIDIFSLDDRICYLKGDNGCLLIASATGKVVQLNLKTNRIKREVDVGGSYPFLFQDKIATMYEGKIVVKDWEGNVLKEIGYSAGFVCGLLKQTENYSILSYQTTLVVFNHSTMELKEYKTGEILHEYLCIGN